MNTLNKKLNIALIGHGKMGHSVAELAHMRGHCIGLIIEKGDDWSAQEKLLRDCDLAIEFTTPAAATENIRKCFHYNLPVITGTTGWLHELPAITRLCHETGQALFYAANFSIGVNIFFELNKKLAGLLSNMSGYKARISETHHTEKLDTPSGTAIKLAADIISARESLHGWAAADEELADDMLPIKAYRMENVTGTHVISYESPIDDIEIKHAAHSRNGFAEGALLAAEWIHHKQGVFTMQDLLKF